MRPFSACSISSDARKRAVPCVVVLLTTYFARVVELDGPGGDGLGVCRPARCAARRRATRRRSRGCPIAGIHDEPEARLDVARLQVRQAARPSTLRRCARRPDRARPQPARPRVCAHVAAQIAVGGLPCAAFGIAVDEASQVRAAIRRAVRPVSASMRGQLISPVSFSDTAAPRPPSRHARPGDSAPACGARRSRSWSARFVSGS